MATVLRHIIAESGGNYSTLNAWEAAIQQNLVTGQKIARAEISGFWNNPITQTCVINGWTTDKENYIEIEAVGNARHTGSWTNDAFRMEVLSGKGFHIIGSSVDIRGVQIAIDYISYTNGWDQACFAIDGNYITSKIKIDGCIGSGTLKTGAFGWHCFLEAWESASNSDYIISNCLMYNFGSNRGSNLDDPQGGIIGYDYGNYYIYNCSAINCQNGFMKLRSSTPFMLKNCMAINCRSGFAGIGFSNSSSNNYTNCTSISFGSNFISGSEPPLFLDSGNFNFNISKNDNAIKNRGINLCSNLADPVIYDIKGRIRRSWDIGHVYIGEPSKFIAGNSVNIKSLKWII